MQALVACDPPFAGGFLQHRPHDLAASRWEDGFSPGGFGKQNQSVIVRATRSPYLSPSPPLLIPLPKRQGAYAMVAHRLSVWTLQHPIESLRSHIERWGERERAYTLDLLEEI